MNTRIDGSIVAPCHMVVNKRRFGRQAFIIRYMKHRYAAVVLCESDFKAHFKMIGKLLHR